MHFCCSLVLPWCSLLVLINVSLLCCMFLLFINVSLCVLNAHQCLLVVCSCCSSTPPYYVFLKFIGASLCFAFLLFVSTSLLCFVGVHRHFFCCVWLLLINTSFLALLLLVGTSLLCVVVACWRLIVMHFWCLWALPCCTLSCSSTPPIQVPFQPLVFFITSLLSIVVAHWHFLLVHSRCSSMPPYCVLCSCPLSTPLC